MEKEMKRMHAENLRMAEEVDFWKQQNRKNLGRLVEVIYWYEGDVEQVTEKEDKVCKHTFSEDEDDEYDEEEFNEEEDEEEEEEEDDDEEDDDEEDDDEEEEEEPPKKKLREQSWKEFWNESTDEWQSWWKIGWRYLEW
jgi:hypothetical protein